MCLLSIPVPESVCWNKSIYNLISANFCNLIWVEGSMWAFRVNECLVVPPYLLSSHTLLLTFFKQTLSNLIRRYMFNFQQQNISMLNFICILIVTWWYCLPLHKRVWIFNGRPLTNQSSKSINVLFRKYFQNALEKSVSKELKELKENVQKNTWYRLAKTVLAKITVFNKRRGEEPSKMLLSSFEMRKKPEHHNAEIKQALNQVELHLLGR